MGIAANDLSGVISERLRVWERRLKVQRISGLTIKIEPGAAIFRFHTVKPAAPTIDIYRSVTGDQAKDLVAANLVQHDIHLTGLGHTKHKFDMRGLAQNTAFFYRIVATDGIAPPAVLIGTFMTSSRSATVTIESILRFNEAGDDAMRFWFGLYETLPSGTRMLTVSNTWHGEIETGGVKTFPMGITSLEDA